MRHVVLFHVKRAGRLIPPGEIIPNLAPADAARLIALGAVAEVPSESQPAPEPAPDGTGSGTGKGTGKGKKGA